MTTAELELVKNDADVIVSGSTWKAIWHMSWPGLLQMIAVSIASFADVWVAGKLGPEVQAAIGIGGQIWFFMTLFAVALSAGTTALVSRFWGAKDYDGAIEASRQSLVFAVLFGIASSALGLFIAKPLYQMLGATPSVQALGWDYLKWDLLSQVPFTGLWVAHSIFRAKGDAKTPLVVWATLMVLICACNVMFCLSPFKMGIGGIGLSWLIAGTVGFILDIFFLSRSSVKECVNIAPILKHGLSKVWFKRLFDIGIPACIQDLCWVGGNFVLFTIFAHTPDPTSCAASWAVGLRVEEMLCGLPIFSVGMAIGTIVGQNLGAKQPDRAERAGWQCAAIASTYNAVIASLMFLFAHELADLMSDDAKVIQYTTQFFQVVSICEPFVALWIVLFGAMQGAGYTKWTMWASSVCLVLFRLPLAWYLTVPLHMAPFGCWLALSVSATVVGSLAVWRFKTGVWKTQTV